MKFITFACLNLIGFQVVKCNYIPNEGLQKSQLAEDSCGFQQQEECTNHDAALLDSNRTSSETLNFVSHPLQDNGTDDSLASVQPSCQLYMAESSIPNAGLGVYTATTMKSGELFHGGIQENVITIIARHLMKLKRMLSEIFSPEEWKEWNEVTNGKYDREGSCIIWARDGECDLNRNYMMNACASSCSVVAAGLDLYKGMVFQSDSDSSCKFWAETGECEANQDFMVKTCPKSCFQWKYNIVMDENLVDDYTWSADSTPLRLEASHRVSLVIPGIGALSNSHLGLHNTDVVFGNITSVSTEYHRASDPEAGASVDHRVGFKAITDIPAGMELFVDYGGGYFESREDEMGLIPLAHNYANVDKILEDFWKTVDSGNVDENKARESYDDIKDSTKDPKEKMLMPQTFGEAKERRGVSSAMASLPNAVRSPEWLKRNGMCIDNIRPGISTIPRAGKGAFASRSIKEGEIFAPMPLLHMKKSTLRKFRDLREVNEQIILNYSFGHPKSSLLLFPYSPFVSFVNNNADKSHINAKLQWSSSKFHKKSWEKHTVDDIIVETHPGLVLEIVATKDIGKDDEIFLDYGSEWDEAWEKHLKSWEAPPLSHDYMPIDILNKEPVIRTLKEQETDPYGYNVGTVCWFITEDLVHDITMTRGLKDLNWADYAVDAEMKLSFGLSEELSVECDQSLSQTYSRL